MLPTRQRVIGMIVWVASVVCGAVVGCAQFAPGDVLVAERSGRVWRIDPSGARASIASFPTPTFGLAVSYAGEVLASGRGVIWRRDGNGVVSTLASGGNLVGVVHGLAPTPRGTVYATTLGAATVFEFDGNGVAIRQYAIPGALRTWGIDIDPSNGDIVVNGFSSVHVLDPVSRVVTTLFTGSPIQSFQGGAIDSSRRFVFGDEVGRSLFRVDPLGNVVTLHAGAPLIDPGEGVGVLANGDVAFLDDGNQIGAETVFVLRAGGLTTLASGAPFSDLNGLAVAPTLTVTRTTPAPSPGQTVTFGLTSTGADGCDYFAAASFTNQNGFAVPGGRTIPLDQDALFGLSVSGLLPAVFQGFRGSLDAAGAGTLAVAVPADARLIGLGFWVATIALNATAPGGIHLISNPVRTVVQ